MSIDIWIESPDRCDKCGSAIPQLKSPCDSINITHNVSGMWSKAGIYDAFYQSDGWTITEPYLAMLRAGLAKFESEYKEFEKLNAANGWGKAENALPFLKKWIEICSANIGCRIRVSR
jgi:hypothetical protein